MHDDIQAYNDAQGGEAGAICHALAGIIDAALPGEARLWHGGPVWFIDGNPIVGYWARKAHVQLLFWSGQSFDEPGLRPEGKFKAAEVRLTDAAQVDAAELTRWLAKARTIQWDYKHLVKRRGVLEKLGTW